MPTIKNHNSTVSIDPSSGQVVNWSKNGVNFLYQGSSVRRSGIPILFPFANPLRNNTLKYSGEQMPQHGFGRDVAWEFEQINDKKAIMKLASSALTEDLQHKYPFQFEATIKIDISDAKSSSTLAYILEIENIGDVDLPIAPGIHPYFPLSHKLKPDLKIVQDEEVLDISAINWEQEMDGNFYEFKNTQVSLENFDLTISCNNPDLYKLVLWSQTPAKDDSDFICLEQFTRDTNGINDNPILVQQGKVWCCGITYEVALHSA